MSVLVASVTVQSTKYRVAAPSAPVSEASRRRDSLAPKPSVPVPVPVALIVPVHPEALYTVREISAVTVFGETATFTLPSVKPVVAVPETAPVAVTL